ncbi:MAG TPA: DUF3592 domain-containing protein [Xanthobacteraceae bacterium]|nr:DUF3592 domain-containing protein [Xanthobacteraceae bacterium]
MIDAILILFGVIAFAVGVVLYVVQLRQGLRADASKKWPKAQATVIASALESSPEHKRRYRAAIRYRYRVGAKNYQSDRVFWGGNEGRRRHMESVVSLYPAGASIGIHYDPQNPAEAVIDPARFAGSRVTVVYAMAMITIGVFAFGGGIYGFLH